MKSIQLHSNKPLVVHFDINETILLGDIAGGDSVEDCLHKIMAKSAFVQVPQDITDLSSFVPTHWWDGTPLDSHINNKTAHVPPLWTESHWPPNTAPYYRTAYKSKSKTFLHHDGAMYRSILEQIPLPPTEGRFAHILPALFTTLWTLATTSSSSSSNPIRLVFRTMGHDLYYIAEAITAFAQGQHPDYPNFFYEPYIWNQPQQFLRAYWKTTTTATTRTTTTTNNDNDDRHDHHHNNKTTTHSTTLYGLKQLNKENQKKDKNNDNDQNDTNDSTIVAEGDIQVLQHLQQFTICGIQDDYTHWEQCQFRPMGGKPIWDNDTEYHMLFDDNIFPMLPNYSIAGIRRNDTYIVESDTNTNPNGYLIPVRTLLPLQNTNWFLENIYRIIKITQHNTEHRKDKKGNNNDP